MMKTIKRKDGDQWQSSIIKKNQTMKDGEGEDEKYRYQDEQWKEVKLA